MIGSAFEYAMDACTLSASDAAATPKANLSFIDTAKSGVWSDPATWKDGKVPGAGSRARIAEGHKVVYDVESDDAFPGRLE